MRSAIAPQPTVRSTELDRAKQYLRPLGERLVGALDGVTITERAPTGSRPSLLLDVPDVGAVEILVGRDWFWWAKPRRPIDLLDDIEHTATAVIETLRRAQLRIATKRQRDRATALDGRSG